MSFRVYGNLHICILRNQSSIDHSLKPRILLFLPRACDVASARDRMSQMTRSIESLVGFDIKLTAVSSHDHRVSICCVKIYTILSSDLSYTVMWTLLVVYLLETLWWSRRSHGSRKREIQHSSSVNGPLGQYTPFYLSCTHMYLG